VSVAGIVVDDEGRVLLIQRRDNRHWEPPGGVLELGETFEEGVVREVLEETGVRVTVERLTGVYKNMTRGIVALVYRCRPISGSAGPTDEAAKTAWLAPAELPDLMTTAYLVRVEDAFSEHASSRSHNGLTLFPL